MHIILDAAIDRNLQKDDVLFQLDGIMFRKATSLDLSKVQQLPTHKFVIERYYTQLSELAKTLSKKNDIVLANLTNELRYYWIFMNIPPKMYKGTRNKVQDIINQVKRLRNTAKEKRKTKYHSDLETIKDILDDGFDIRGKESEDVEEFEVTVGEEEEELYRDNCLRIGEKGEKLAKCSRERWCGGVDKTWWKKAQDRKMKMEKQKQFTELRAQGWKKTDRCQRSLKVLF